MGALPVLFDIPMVIDERFHPKKGIMAGDYLVFLLGLERKLEAGGVARSNSVEGAGTHFDPALVDVCLGIENELSASPRKPERQATKPKFQCPDAVLRDNMVPGSLFL